MPKRSSFEIKKKILFLLKSGYLTYAQLERKTNTGFRTVKNNCDELESYGFIGIKKNKKHPKSGKPYSMIVITEKGREFIVRSLTQNL